MQIWHLPMEGGEPAVTLPWEWLLKYGTAVPDALRETSAEVSPGVRVSILSTGRTTLPDGRLHLGVRLIVWTDEDTDPVKKNVPRTGAEHELAVLRDKYERGWLTTEQPLMLGNDTTTAYDAQGAKVFSMNPGTLLRAALSLLGIPHEHV